MLSLFSMSIFIKKHFHDINDLSLSNTRRAILIYRTKCHLSSDTSRRLIVSNNIGSVNVIFNMIYNTILLN